MEWNSSLYDKKHDFVAEYGKGLLEFVPKNNEQTILDLGCGTGMLTVQLADVCSKVVGVDSSQNMIDKAKKQFSNVEFLVCEFGANGNIATIENAFIKVCQRLGYSYKPKFNFPTVETFGEMLEKNGLLIIED